MIAFIDQSIYFWNFYCIISAFSACPKCFMQFVSKSTTMRLQIVSFCLRNFKQTSISHPFLYKLKVPLKATLYIHYFLYIVTISLILLHTASQSSICILLNPVESLITFLASSPVRPIAIRAWLGRST